MDKNAKKSEQLGMPFGTATAKLRKMILFSLVQKLGLDCCYRCTKRIQTINDFTIDHKNPWLNNNTELFWDLNNIAFSHVSCNVGAARKSSIRALGENHGQSKLTEGDVKEIRASNGSFRGLAMDFGVSRNTVRSIVRLETWKHI